MIVLETKYELVHQVNEPKFLNSLKTHLLNVKSLFQEVLEIVVFNVGDHEFPTFAVHFHFKSDSEDLYALFKKKHLEHIRSDFPPEIALALKTEIRALMPWPDFLQ